MTEPTTSSGMSWGSTVMPPRRATVSAIRRPATAVMLATTTGQVRADAVGRRQVDVEARPDRRQAGHHEHVVVGEVVSRVGVEQAHAAVLGSETGPPKVTAADRAARPGSARPDRALYAARRATPADATPVVLVHGWGGSFETTWRQSGFTELLADAGRPVIGVDLLGHGEAPKPHDPADVRRPDDAHRRRRCPTSRSTSSGSRSGRSRRCGWPSRQPERFRRLVLSPASAATCSSATTSGAARILAGVEGTADPDDNVARLFGQYADQPGNDRRRPRRRA